MLIGHHPRRHRPPIFSGGFPQKTITVGSIVALKNALADNTIDNIIVTNGTYHVSPSNAVAADSLWIGSNASGGFPFAERTRPVTVKAQTIGGVTFDGTAGGIGYGGLSFEDGAHHQTWQGFNFANMVGDFTGIIEIAGYTDRAAVHDITLLDMTVLDSCQRNGAGSNNDHGVYIAQSLLPGSYNIWIERLTMVSNNALNLVAGIHCFHGGPGNPNASQVTIKNSSITGFNQAILIWPLLPGQIYNWLLDTITITNAKVNAFSYADHPAVSIVARNITSTGTVGPAWNPISYPNPTAAGWTVSGMSLN